MTVDQLSDKLYGNNSIPYPKQIFMINSFLDSAGNSLSPEEMSELHLMLGTRYVYINAYPQAQQHLNIAFENGTPVQQSRANLNMGNVFLDMKSYEEALIFYDRVTNFDKEYFRKDITEVNLNYVKGICFENLDEFEQAISYYSIAIDQAQKIGDREMISILLNQKGGLMLEAGDHEEAYALFIEAKTPYIMKGSVDLVAHIYSNIARYYTKVNDQDSVNHYLNLSDSIATEFELADVKLFNSRIRYENAKERGDYRNALDLLTLYNEMEDSLYSYRLKTQFYSLQEAFELEQKEKQILQHKQQIEMLKKDEEIARNRLYLFIGAVILGSIILLLIIFRLRSDVRKRKEILKVNAELHRTKMLNKELESDRLRNDLELKNKSLTDLAIGISRKKAFTEDILKKLKQLKRSSDKDFLLNDLIGYTSRQLNIDDRLSLMWSDVEKINHGFFDELAKRHPALTKGEIQMCALIRLKLSNKDIATIKGVTPDSAKNMRSRLGKKLELEGQTIQEYLIGI
jgi:tetratricopeptide (TPR) repeat protein